MKVHFIGHASLMFETVDRKILMDPVFWDPQQDGVCAVSPQRSVRADRLPDYNLIVISHRHLDHFDIRTLSTLNRNCPVIIPAGDAALSYALRKLRFQQVRALGPLSRLTLGRTEILLTPSAAPDPEFGLMVRDPTGTVWNQVDTQVTPSDVRGIRTQFGPADLLIATWQPLLEIDVLCNKPTGFPYKEYFRLLTNIKLAAARAVVPGSCGFKYVGEAAWLNKFVFPASRQQFLRDVERLAPESKSFLVNPGDTVAIEGGEARLRAGDCEFVEMELDDSSETSFDPTGHVPELKDPNPDGLDEREMLQTIETFFRGRMATALAESFEKRGLAYEYRGIGLIYQLDVVFPSGSKSWSMSFDQSGFNLIEGSHPSAHINSRIAASALTDLILARRTTDYVTLSGLYRWFQRAYLIAPHSLNEWRPMNQTSMGDPLWMALSPEDILRKYIDRELERYDESGNIRMQMA
jgi:hypothetical protein